MRKFHGLSHILVRLEEAIPSFQSFSPRNRLANLITMKTSGISDRAALRRSKEYAADERLRKLKDLRRPDKSERLISSISVQQCIIAAFCSVNFISIYSYAIDIVFPVL